MRFNQRFLVDAPDQRRRRSPFPGCDRGGELAEIQEAGHHLPAEENFI